MFSSELTTPAASKPRAIQSCPRCLSIEIETVTPIPNASFRDAAYSAWDDCWKGNGLLATRFFIRWGCVRTANALRDKHRCSHCGFSFREVRP